MHDRREIIFSQNSGDNEEGQWNISDYKYFEAVSTTSWACDENTTSPRCVSAALSSICMTHWEGGIDDRTNPARHSSRTTHSTPTSGSIPLRTINDYNTVIHIYALNVSNINILKWLHWQSKSRGDFQIVRGCFSLVARETPAT
jgi:hypothetical protein